MSENEYAETPAKKRSMAREGTIAAWTPEKVETPAASASTPAPTMFLARFTVIDVALVPLEPSGAAAASMLLLAREVCSGGRARWRGFCRCLEELLPLARSGLLVGVAQANVNPMMHK